MSISVSDVVLMERTILGSRCATTYSADKARFAARLAKRASGSTYTINEYIKAMVYSFLTNTRSWALVLPHLPTIDRLFSCYNPTLLCAASPTALARGILHLHCGNRHISGQMSALAGNIRVLQAIDSDPRYGSIDGYFRTFTSYPAFSYTDVKSILSDFKKRGWKEMGIPLFSEYLKNVGFDVPKPDRHLKRILGGLRTNKTSLPPRDATDEEVFAIVDSLAKASSGALSRQEIDLILWAFCADNYAEICVAIPKCSVCPLSSRYHGGSC